MVDPTKGEGDGSLTICEYCHKDFRTPSLLARHITVHTKEKKYVCGCGRGYTRPDRFRKHAENCGFGGIFGLGGVVTAATE